MKKKKKTIGIFGGGGWGTALGKKLAKNSKVRLWSKDLDPHFKKTIIQESDLIVVAVPTFAIREVVNSFKTLYWGQPILGVSKGLEKETALLPSQIVQEILGKVIYGHLSGPSFAGEVAQGLPVGFNLGLSRFSQKRYFQEIINLENAKVRITPDLIGVQLGGALKNVVALVSGISDNLGMGNNFRAFLIWQGLQEIIALGRKIGAREKTFLDLSGVGDLILTSISIQSRNYRAGLKIGKQKRVNLEELKMGTVEGLDTAFGAFQLARKFKLKLPIIEGVYKILYQKENPKKILGEIKEKIINGKNF